MLKSKPVPYEPFTPKPVERREEEKPEVLTSDEIRLRLAAREKSIREHVAALKTEVTSVEDVTVAGRPVLGHVRAHPLEAVGIAAASGAAVGLLVGALRRALSRPEEESEEALTIRLLVTSLLDDAAERVARGEDANGALRRAASRHAPTIYYAPNTGHTAKGTLRETFDLALKSALGFGVKAGMDLLTKRLTGTPEVFTAAKEASENP
jgi:ElaB/YqjD/DUF883 family membrane-anchored ribosome-binding protein